MIVDNAAVGVDSCVVSDVDVERSRPANLDAALVALPAGWFWHARPWLELIDRYRPALAVELGSYNGASAIATARVLAHWGGRLVCVDTWADGTSGPPHRFDAFTRHVAKAKLTNIEPIIARTDEAASRWTYGPIDALYIDADHSEAGVTSDLVAWWPWLRDGGLIGGDDCDNPEYPGVRRAWESFAAKTGQHLEFTTHHDAAFPLVWAVKGSSAPAYVPTPSLARNNYRRHAMKCAVCHRVVWNDHLDARGRCCFCLEA